ncbi:tetratricopeptide repeat 4 [Brachionus plicatilis]|uniref:Tetratricopeptide repeat 4 n=1 Tax=Brachionus plicatilis TaxID=10195 RepID=A0A3M7R384_BRAPC|nr:tetratricopeptide repeat 4 [Brachionus plicatilis]
MEGKTIRQLKWDPDDTPKEKAIKLKDEGNLYFRAKNYSQAVVSYTMALKEELDHDDDLKSTLHQNRAAAHYHIKNYRSSLSDCVFARKFNPKNIKPIYRGAECSYELKKFDDCIKWCDMGLEIDSEDAKLRSLRSKAESEKKSHEKEKRKKEMVERKRNQTFGKIWSLIKAKGIEVQENEKMFFSLLENPANSQQKRVSISSQNDCELNWPVIFLYPEMGQTDFIEEFSENSIFSDHLNVMFSQSPDWDSQKMYNPSSIQIYYDNRKKGKLMKIDHQMTLMDALRKEGMIIQMGTPSFVLLKKITFIKLVSIRFNLNF